MSPRRPLPALTEHRRLRYSVLVLLYVGQGLPMGLLVVALPAFLAEQGASAVAVGGYMSAVLLPFALKVLVGPVMDRYTFLPMGRRRPWILTGGLGVVASVAAMAQISDPLGSLGWLVAAGVAVTVSVAILDTAADGMAVDVVPDAEQPRANALMWGGATLGVAMSAVGTGVLLDAYGLELAAAALAVTLGLLWLVPLSVRERPRERLLPWTRGDASPEAVDQQPRIWTHVGRELRDALLLPSSLALLAAAAFAGALDGLVIAFMPVLAVQDLGWADTEYSGMVAIGQVVAGLLGMAIGSVLIARVGRVRMLAAMAALVAVVLALMAAVPGLWTAKATLVVFAIGYLVSFVLLTITLLATGMALCSRAVAATQFALFTAAMNVGRSSGAALLGPLDRALSPSAMLAVTAGLAVLVVLLASRIRLDVHRASLSEPTSPSRPALPSSAGPSLRASS